MKRRNASGVPSLHLTGKLVLTFTGFRGRSGNPHLASLAYWSTIIINENILTFTV